MLRYNASNFLLSFNPPINVAAMNLKKYIGIPFKDKACGFDGCDCYGLVRLVYKEELKIELPYLGDQYSTAFNRGEVSGVVQGAVDSGWAADVEKGNYKLFDVLAFRRGVDDAHVGLWIAPSTMLHILEGSNAGCERFDGVRWGRMLHRVIRHVTRM